MARNMYKNHPEYNEMVKRIMGGQELTFANVSGFETKTMGQTQNEAPSGRLMKKRKQKKYD